MAERYSDQPERHGLAEKQVKMAYSFDRLEEIKISQVYKLLVPEEIKACRKDNSSMKNKGDIESENGSNLCKSLIWKGKEKSKPIE
jgi:hypothetical protein